VIDREFEKGIAEIINAEELETLLKSGKKLRIKWGADPSAPDLHLGHTVVIRKLKFFQELGHEVIFLIGSFTAMIGDPSGKSKTRKVLTAEEVFENAKTYQEQVFKILDREKTTVVYNGDWLNKLSAKDLIHITAQYNVARMLEREDFNKRFKNNQSISLHEFIYPLLQGYDSVHLKADIEMGGTDQKFNLLVGRHLQKEYAQKPQIIITMPILEGLDGVQKMSKSLGNHIGLTDSAYEMFGKLMSIPDILITKYYELLTAESIESIELMKTNMANNLVNPRDLKVRLGKMITAQYHGENKAEEAHQNFIQLFQRKEIPDEIPEFTLSRGQHLLFKVLTQAGIAPSNKEAQRLIVQRATSVNSKKINDVNYIIPEEDEIIIKAGKRNFLKIKWENTSPNSK